MISLEMAQKLKEAGLEWEPQRGDWYYFWDDGELHLLRVAIPKPVPEVFYSAPRLDRMLADIEKLGFIWALDVSATNGNKVIGYAMNIATSLDWEDEEEFRSDSPEEAAASALLWICEGRAATRCGLSDG